MKLLQTNKGFSKTGILITIGIFVLVVAISIPVAFGFIKDDHPEANIDSSQSTTETQTPSKEVELGIVDKILPSSDLEYEEGKEQIDTDKDTSESTTPTNPSAPNKPSYTPSAPIIKGEADTNIKVEIEVEEEGQVFVPETKPTEKYEDVDVKDEDVVVIPPVIDTTPEETTPPTTTPSEPKEDDVVGKELEEVEDGEMPDFLP